MSENTKHMNKTFHISIETTFYETYQTKIIEKGSTKKSLLYYKTVGIKLQKALFLLSC